MPREAALCLLIEQAYRSAVTECVNQGCAGIGVAKQDGEGPRRLLGVLPLRNPLHPESAGSIQQTKAMGLSIKMFTGESTRFISMIARYIGLGFEIMAAEQLDSVRYSLPTREAQKSWFGVHRRC